MSEKIKTHKDLRVWQEAMDMAMDVFALSKRFPKDELYSLTDQIRRSSRSVPANIAEAWRKRRYPAAFIAKLNDAEGEAAETQTHLEIALRCGYLEPSVVAPLDARYETLLAQLVTMATHPDKWTVSGPRETGRQGDGERGRRGDRETIAHEGRETVRHFQTLQASPAPQVSKSPPPQVPQSSP